MTLNLIPIQLKCYDKIKEHFLSLLEEHSTEDYYAFVLPITDELHMMFTEEMQNYGLSPRRGWLAFKKKNCFDIPYDYPGVHLDYTDITGSEICNVSFVIPLEGCEENAPMFWYTGNYEVEQVDKGTYTYAHAVWKDAENMTIHKEDITGPAFCRVNVPHETWSNPDGSYRATVTVRFYGNPTLEEIYEKISKNT